MFTLASLIVAALSVLLYRFLKTRKHALPLPPGPHPRFLFGNALEESIRKSRYLWLKLHEYAQSYGGIVSFWLLRQPVVALSDPGIITELLEKRATSFSTRPPITMAKLSGWSDSILFTPYNQRLRIYRKLLHQTFNPRATLDFQNLQIDEVQNLMKRLATEPEGFRNHAHLFAGGVSIRIAYGYTVHDANDKFIRAAEEFMGAVGEATVPGRWLVEVLPFLRHIPSWFPGAVFKRKTEEWRKMTVGYRQEPYDFVIKQMSEGTAETSFVSKLLEPADGSLINADDREIVKVLASSLYGAGADTTVSLLLSFFLAMTLHQHAQSTAQAEIDAYLLTRGTRILRIEDREHLPYTHAVVMEVMRWHPVINVIARYTDDDQVIGAHVIPKGTIVIGNIWSVLHDPARYSDPETFRPERFLGDSPDPDPGAWAFGFGRRICPGIHIAQQSLWLTISNIIANFTIAKARRDDGSEIIPKEEYTPDILSHPAPFECSIKVRSSEAQSLIDDFEH